VNITRAHLDEDVGLNVHFEAQQRACTSIARRNAAGKLFSSSEPEMTSATRLKRIFNALKDILIYVHQAPAT